MSDPEIVIIAGPDGAGKTTFAGDFLPKEAACPNFVNADRDAVNAWAVYGNSGDQPVLTHWSENA